MRFYLYKDISNEWRWYVKTSNGNKIADSGEGYKNKYDCLAAIGLVISTNSQTPITDLST